MKRNQLKKLTVAISGALIMGFGVNAMADSTFDLVQALVSKGVLTEEEALPLLKGRENDIHQADEKVKKAARVGISSAIDNATLYGDMRVRVERRDGEDVAGNKQARTRDRYKLTLGVKTESGPFYTDLALAMGGAGRSDNATFGSGSNGDNKKESANIKRAMIGWHATDWLDLEAGRVKNPLYTNQMVWDGDLTFEGLVEKAKFDAGNAKIFLTAVQSQYIGDTKEYSGAASGKTDTISNWLMAFQAGAEMPISDKVKAKAAVTYTTYSNNNQVGDFNPAGTDAAKNIGKNVYGTNDLRTIEVPFEVGFKTDSDFSYKLFGDYVYNIDGSDRAKAAAIAAANPLYDTNDDKAWLLGAGIKSQAGKKEAKGDWQAKIWYQDVGMYSVDPNAVDSDFFDSKVNMKGTVLKAQYNVQENVFVSFAAGYGKHKDSNLQTAGVKGDLGYDLKDMSLYQLDLNYKF